MYHLLVRITVEDYAKWKAQFDEFGAARQAEGSRGARVLRNVDKPNEVIAISDWDDVAMARKMAGSQELRDAQRRAGVTGVLDVLFLEETDRQAA